MKIADVFSRVVGPDVPVRFDAYDGSTAGPADAPVRIDIRTPIAVSYIATSPGELGLARAYVTGQLDIHGELYDALRALSDPRLGRLSLRERAEIVRDLGPGMLRPMPRPREEVKLRGPRHSRSRDARAIAHHYDVSNRFYEMFLGPSMAYTCAVYPRADATLEEAQHEKFDLVARKLDLQSGQRLLDVGCGWGGMVMHAAEHYGVSALGVTLSRRQAEWAQKAIADRGLSDRAEVRFLDYRDVPESTYDAVSSIGLTEHIGKGQLPAYFRFLRAKLRPEGRLLNHCITRPTTKSPVRAGKFINRYVFPDGELEAVGTIVSAMQDNGLEVRHEENLREHYARTLRAWVANLDAHWDESVREVGEGRARVWRLYMAASRLGFDRDNIELHQVLGVRTADDGSSGMPLRPTW
jgi:cyclopropane-fatty-acyl-phospholipid synthase